jgi:hypothetical protein
MGEGQRNRELNEKPRPKETHVRRCKSQQESQTSENSRQTPDGKK